MRNKLKSLIYLVILFNSIVLCYAGECFAEPTKEYIKYIYTAKIVTFITGFFILYVTNMFITLTMFKLLKDSVTRKRKIIFDLIITSLSFLFYIPFHFMILPSYTVQSLGFGGEKITLIRLLYLLTLPPFLILLSFGITLSFIATLALLKFYLKTPKPNLKITLAFTALMTPFLGSALCFIISKLFHVIFPFNGVAWIHCF